MSATHETSAHTPRRVRAEVTGRPLRIGGAHFNVGERIVLDPTNPQHRQVLDAPGWVRRLDPIGPPVASNSGKITTEEVVPVVETNVAVAIAPAAPHEHRMIEQPQRREKKTR